MKELKDRYGKQLYEDCIVYAKTEDGSWHFFSLWTHENGEVNAIACTWGYMHRLTQESIAHCILIGSQQEFEFTQKCD